MPFTPKDWENDPSTDTPISAEALEDLETRVTDYAETYADSVIPGGGGAPVFNVVDFGADPTGAVDSTAEIQAALDAAGDVEGVVHFGNGENVFKYTSTLEGKNGIRMTGSTGGMGGVNRGPTLSYWGTGTSAAIGFGDNSKWEIDHLRWVYRGDTGFTGPVINVTHSTVDPSSWHIHHCEFDRAGTATDSAKAFIRLHKAITGQISECHFDAAQCHIMMGDPDNTASYVNGVHVRNCSFNDCLPDPGHGQILIGARDMQACTITNSVFSGGGASAYVAIRGTNGSTDVNGNLGGDASSNSIYTLTISGNYFGDGTGGVQSAIIGGLNTQTDGPVYIVNNFFGNNYRRCFQAGENNAGVVMIANKATNAPLFGTWDGTPGSELAAFANEGSEDLIVVGEEPTDLLRLQPNNNVVNGYFAISDNDSFQDVIATDRADNAGIIMGGNIPTADPYPNVPHAHAIYGKTTATASFLVLQAGTGDVDNGVQLAAGLGTPTVKVYANGDGVAFNGAVPTARPDYTITNHSNDRALNETADTTAQVANVLGTLINDLIAIGLLQ
jgi:hypothetical protein